MYYLSIAERHEDYTFDLLDCHVLCGKTDEYDEDFYDNEQGSYFSIGTYETLSEVRDIIRNCRKAKDEFSLEFDENMDSAEIKYLMLD